MRKAETQAWSGPITNECVKVASHTSQRAASLEEGRGQPRKGLPSRAQRPGRRGMKFLWVYLVIQWEMGMIEKGETGVCALRVVVATQS